MPRKSIFQELREKEEVENSVMHISKRKYDGKFCVWAPYHNEDLASRYQIISIHNTKGKAEAFVRKHKDKNNA